MDDASKIIRHFENLKNVRLPLENDWRTAASACLARDYGNWQISYPGSYGSTLTSNQTSGANQSRMMNVDTTASLALPKYVALLMKLLTPTGQDWHDIGPFDSALLDNRDIADWFSQVKKILFKKRYEASAGFASCQSQTYTQLGVYGNGAKFIMKDIKNNGIIYKAISSKDIWFSVDENNRPNCVYRNVPNMTKENIINAFGIENISSDIMTELNSSDDQSRTFEIIHCVKANDNIDKDSLAIDKKYAYVGRYIFKKIKTFIGDIEGYNTMPYIISRDYSDPGIAYGYSPAMLCLASIGSANAIKRSLIKIGQKSADPPLIAYDNNSVNGRISLNPSAINFGCLDAQGRELVKPVPIGDFQLGMQLLEEDRNAINDAFHTNLYDLISKPDNGQSEIDAMLRASEKAVLVAPLMERLIATDLGPTIDRELEILFSLKLLPPLPIKLQGKQYKIEYRSPLMKSLLSDNITDFMRVVGWAAQQAQVSGDNTVMARFNFPQAIKDICQQYSIPSQWLRTDDEVAQIAQQNQQAQQAEQIQKLAPAISGGLKAQAVAQQAGGSLLPQQTQQQ